MAQQPLGGTQILVVEDSCLIARHIAAVLAAHGTVVLGPVSSAADAHRVLQRSQPDCVVLDEKFERETCSALSPVLRQRGIPMLVVGHSRHPVPPDVGGRAGKPELRRPVSTSELVSKSRGAIADSFKLLARIREREARQAQLVKKWRLQGEGKNS